MKSIKFSKKTLIICVLSGFILMVGFFNSCKKDNLKDNPNPTVSFQPVLSNYHIFNGSPNKMIPNSGFHLYTLATTLFTDYAEKQRLIKLPAGTKLTKMDDGLPSFPDSTIIVKTFYFFNDARDTTKGRRMIETRLLIKNNGSWNTATYVWNDTQTEAFLQKSGSNTDVAWINSTGQKMAVSYHVPNTRECQTCHNSNDEIIPIGPKLRNLNMDITVGGQTQNQLAYFQSQGILSSFDPRIVAALPQAFNPKYSVTDQARAYLEMNCAHCHNSTGLAKSTNLYMGFTVPFDQTDIEKRKDKIVDKVTKGEMPLLGTTTVHQEGLQLLKDYIATLK
jgi:uncharacterized repeat protein (TIGR03806 family)